MVLLKSMKRLIFPIISILFLAGCGLQPTLINNQENQNSEPLINTNTSVNTNVNENTNSAQKQVPATNVNVNTNADKTTPELTLPEKFDIKVAFASQAPLGDWSLPYQEACEEASMIMAAKYFKNEKLDANIMDQEILKVVKWEEDNGYPLDLTAAQTVEVLQKYFGLKAYLDKMVSEPEIKKNLVAGNLIIVPLAGRDIGNPFYHQPGPLYHMLLIRGFDEDEFITNDPGTKRGEAYRYLYGDLLWAVHDWVGGDREFQDPRPEPDMRTGARVMVVVEK
ncbi:C39 family peptidase [Patescibacteria group bacterium]|nr:C39 family peptidase [Patescibacteria group bacterium]